MVVDRWQHILVTFTVALLALALVGGSIAGWLIGRDPPAWLIGFDGMIITAAFGTGAFFAQGRASEPVSTALADSQDKYHQLAMAGMTASMPVTASPAPALEHAPSPGTQIESPTPSGGTAHAGGS